MPAQRLVFVHFTDKYLLICAGTFHCWQSVGMLGRLTAFDTDSVDFGNIFSPGQKCRHRSERLGQIVHIQAGYNHPDSLVGEHIAYIHDPIVEELNLIYSHNIHIRGIEKNVLGRINGDGLDGFSLVTDHVCLRIAHIYPRLEYLNSLMGKIRPF